MPTECNPTLFQFEPVESKNVVAGFDGGTITSDAGALLLGQLDRGLGVIRRMAACFTDRRDPTLIEHTVETLVGQRVFGLAPGGACPRAGEAGPVGGPQRSRRAAPRSGVRGAGRQARGQARGLRAGGRQEHAQSRI